MEEFVADVDAIDKHINQFSVKSYDEYLYSISKARNIIRVYKLEGKYRYKSQL
jgi:hypothetical protein